MENVMEMVRGPFMGEIFGKIGGLFRESPEGVKRGFESALPLSVAGLAQRASTQEGAQELLSTFKGGEYPHLDAKELGQTVTDPVATAEVARSSEGFLSGLFGNKQRGVVDGLASTAGVSSSTASKLLGLALPMVMGFVGKQVSSRNMDASGLRGFLTSQRKQLGGALPGPLSQLVGGDTDVRDGVSGRRAVAYHGEEAVRKPRLGRWLLLAAAIAAALFLLMSRRGARRQATSIPTPQTQSFANLPRPTALHAGSVTALSEALGGAGALPQRFVLGDLTFRTESAEIDPASARVLDDVAHAMVASPGGRIRVEGHTDSTGMRDVNQQLSQARAESTRTYLMSRGISGDRIEAVGYGADRPIADNDHAAGRADNRRTEIVVVSR
jgi:outer membrane protein OmpA-like peptidoglycan-associated protein